MTQTTIYRPDHDVTSIETQDDLNDLLRAGKLETKLVNNDPETLAAYAEAYWAHNITDLVGFNKAEILKFEKAKAKAKSKAVTSDPLPEDEPQEPVDLQAETPPVLAQEPAQAVQ